MFNQGSFMLVAYDSHRSQRLAIVYCHEHCRRGDLRDLLKQNFDEMTCKTNLHPGNMLLYSCKQGGYLPEIGDFGLSVPESQAGNIEDIEGVLPFIAPEILNGLN